MSVLNAGDEFIPSYTSSLGKMIARTKRLVRESFTVSLKSSLRIDAQWQRQTPCVSVRVHCNNFLQTISRELHEYGGECVSHGASQLTAGTNRTDRCFTWLHRISGCTSRGLCKRCEQLPGTRGSRINCSIKSIRARFDCLSTSTDCQTELLRPSKFTM